MKTETQSPVTAYAGWRTLVAPYQHPDTRIGIWQIVNSFGGLLLCCSLMYWSLSNSYWLTWLLALPAAGFLTRVFIIQHDCGHNSFFKSRRANDAVGLACSLFTMIAYKYWRKGHAIHHAHHAELEERGIGDIWTMTVAEYHQANSWVRVAYRVFRNPFFLFGIAPLINFVILGRLPLAAQANWQHGEKASVWWTNLALLGMGSAVSALIGFGNLLLIYLPVMFIAGGVGTWLFYMQHQFERTYWEHTPQWDYTLAAMQGSSYFKLPRVLQWFTGNIGFHHIHHLSPRIPNYHLQKCHDQNPLFQRVVQLTIRSSFQSLHLTLWDEERQRLVTFREALQIQPQPQVTSLA